MVLRGVAIASVVGRRDFDGDGEWCCNELDDDTACGVWPGISHEIQTKRFGKERSSIVAQNASWLNTSAGLPLF